MGGGAGADKRGRYEEKGGGQWVGSFFGEDAENERIKSAYGNYNLWAWLRYWYLDTENQVTLMLIDKGFHDYDYTEPKPKRKRHTEADNRLLGTDELMKLFLTAAPPEPKKREPETDAERIQREILEDRKLRAESRNEK